ncbi:UNVERIFIED_CONTAM: hypothetical protein FKN15_050435 [Acipenser sinensis]
MTFQVGGWTVNHPIWVAAVQDPCILGLDFLRSTSSPLDLQMGTLHFQGSAIAMAHPGEPATPNCPSFLLHTLITVGELVWVYSPQLKWGHCPGSWQVLERTGTSARCDSCNARKGPMARSTAPLQQIPIGGPIERIGALKNTTNNNKNDGCVLTQTVLSVSSIVA